MQNFVKTILFAAFISIMCCSNNDKKFQDFTIEKGNLDGTTVKLSDYAGKGKYLIVDFWASWCGPCKGEIPNLKNVYEKYAGDDFDVLSIAVWDKEDASKEAIKSHGMTWKQIINAGKIPTDLYGIKGIPQIMLIGPDGTIIATDLRGENIEKTVAKYVQAK